MSNEEVYHQTPKIDESSNPAAVEKGWFDFMKKKEEPEKCEETAISTEFEEKVNVSEPEPVLEEKQAVSTEFEEKVNVSEPEPVLEEKNETLLEKFHQSHDGSSSCSSSDEEVGEDGEKKKKKKQKPLKQVIEEKFEDYKENKEEEKIEKQEEDTYVPVEKREEVAVPPPHSEVVYPTPTPPPHSKVVYPTPTPEPEGKKGLMEKIKNKLPGHKKAEEEHVAPPPPAHVAAPCEPMPAAPPYDGLEEPKEKRGILEKIKEKIPGYHSKSEEEKEKEKVKE